ncbi:nuclear transport factor 2 family protein [Roseicella aquatilis]|uniref:Nuclear transport factor 2 family protein n=1 Tax=Roseicella aquatilis TaxID=2527868 RepID=A0A4R4DT69_9PROT|nr:nuclear transport factor 2 family protein [Roseicella aquatilis]TCZ64793.1 nuclear transport factor 2 family protein [Roseicella aquatilis]
MLRRDLVLAVAGATALGSLLPSIAPAQAQAGEAQAVAQAVEALRKAMVDVDRPALEALTADRLSYGHSAGRIENKAEFVDAIVSRKSPFRFIRLSDQTVSIDGGNAIVRHVFDAENVNPGGVSTAHIGVLQVWTRQGGDWRLLARQAFRL